MRQLKITKQVTNRDTPSLDKYLQEIGRVELISPEDEVVLARKIKNGDADALRKLVPGCLDDWIFYPRRNVARNRTKTPHPLVISVGNVARIQIAPQRLVAVNQNLNLATGFESEAVIPQA